MKRRLLKRSKKGFTLLELLIVIVVLAVLAGLALPQYIRTVARAKEAVLTGAEAVVVSCPYCTMMLEDGLKTLNRELPVYDIAEMVDAAMKGPDDRP